MLDVNTSTLASGDPRVSHPLDPIKVTPKVVQRKPVAAFAVFNKQTHWACLESFRQIGLQAHVFLDGMELVDEHVHQEVPLLQ